MSDEHNREDQPLPGSVSDQNGEEQPPGHGGGEETHKKPEKGDSEPLHGGAGEGSQSTGHPENAG
ncbi:MAG: hypothetical protein WAU75_20240 [Solirubrobacteraceae bacterium]